MKRSRGFSIFAALLGVGLCGVVYRSLPSGTLAPDEADFAPTKGRIGHGAMPESPELAEMRQEMAQLKRQMSTQGQRLASVDSAEAERQAPATDPRTDPEVRAEEERKHREYIAGVDAAFHKETLDPRWSSATSSVVQAALLADNELRPLARGVECRSYTCRVEIADDGSGKLGRVLPMFAQQVSQNLPGIIAGQAENTNGTTMMVLYMSRRDDAPAMAQ